MNGLTFWEASIIAGIALVGPVISGVVALVAIRWQASDIRKQSVRNARRDKIEEAITLLMPLPNLIRQCLVEWIETGQLVRNAHANGNSQLIRAATESIRDHPLNSELPDRSGKAAMLVELYMPESRDHILKILQAFRNLTGDERTKGSTEASAVRLASDLMREFEQEIAEPMHLLIQHAKALINE